MELQRTNQNPLRSRESTSPTPPLDPTAQDFLDRTNEQEGKPLYKMNYREAREVLEKIQSASISPLPVKTEDHTLPVGPTGDISVRIFRPSESKEILPIVMYFHGGGWVLGSENTHDRLVRELTHATQAAFVFVKYTPSPEARYPIPTEQAYAATRYFAEHGRDFGLDSERIAVAGDSAGGCIAAVVALMCKQRGTPKLSYQALLYPVTDCDFENASYTEFAEGFWLSKAAMEWFWDAYAPRIEDREQITASPLKADLKQLQGLPPTLIITDTHDVLRDEGEAYAYKLAEAGVEVTTTRYLSTIHDFMMLNDLADTEAAKCAIVQTAEKLRQAFSRALH